MKKSLVALAVASAFAAPAFAATSNVDVYGVVHFAIEDTNVDNSDIQVTDRVSRIGFKGSEDLGGGMKAVFQFESGVNPDATGGTWVNRDCYVGLGGNFGTVLLGWNMTIKHMHL